MMKMASNKYWKQRMELLEEAQLKKGQNYLVNLDKQYKITSANIERELTLWYERFAINNQISMSESKKILNAKELKEFQWSVEDYIKYGRENALNKQWMKQLENASVRVHVSRLESLKIQMQQQVEVLYGNQIDSVDKILRGIYSDGYYHTAYEIQKGFNIGWDLHSLNKNQLDKILSKPWSSDKRTFSDRLWNNKEQLIGTLQTKLTQAVIRGEEPKKAIDAIADQFDIDKRKAGRLVMTESAAFASIAQKDCFKDLDVEKYEIVATLDGRTSDLCQDLDGEIFDMKDYEVGMTAPPFHPWCRTTTVPFFEDNYGERAARDEEGNVYYVPTNMKYHEWKKKFVDGGSKEGLKKMIKSIDDCGTVREVEELMKCRQWFMKGSFNGKIYDSNEKISLKGCELEGAKKIYIAHDEVFNKYPQLIGKFAATRCDIIDEWTYAQCSRGFGCGGITLNTEYYKNVEQLIKIYAQDVQEGFHPLKTDWTSIVTHELGHAIDDHLSNYLHLGGTLPSGKFRNVSAVLRPKVMKNCGLKVSDIYEEVSGYASKNNREWFAECFAEYMKSDTPRQVAIEFGEQLNKIMKEVK